MAAREVPLAGASTRALATMRATCPTLWTAAFHLNYSIKPVSTLWCLLRRLSSPSRNLADGIEHISNTSPALSQLVSRRRDAMSSALSAVFV